MEFEDIGDVKENLSHWWAFPCCSCLFMILMIGVLVSALAVAFDRQQGEEAPSSYIGGGDLNAPLNMDPTRDGACIDAYIKSKSSASPLVGFGSSFISAGQQFNINPALLVAIGGAESSFATNWDANPPSTKNFANVTCVHRSPNCVASQNSNPRNWRVYSSYSEAISSLASLLRNNYFDKGYDTIEKIGARYCGVTCTHWFSTTRKYYDELSSQCKLYSSITPSGTGDLILPFDENNLSSGQSKCNPLSYWDNTGRTYKPTHGGLDYTFKTGIGTQLYAAATGKIIALYQRHQNWPADVDRFHDGGSEHGGAGNYIVVKITEGKWEGYSFEFHHLSPGSVPYRVGDAVQQGMALGKVGHNGVSSGPHLHFQVNKPHINSGPNFNLGPTYNPREAMGCQ